MNDLQIFTNEEFGQVRTITEGDKTLFCGSDVAKALGYSNPRDALARHCRCVVKHDAPHPQNPAKAIELAFIPESDIYRLIISSKLPAAEKFEHWVFEDVLPTIRKHGIYMTDQRLKEMLMRPDTIINIALTLKREQLKNIILTEDNVAFQPPRRAGGAHGEDRVLAREVRRERSELCHFRRNDANPRSPKGSLMPYKKYAEGGLFELKECANERTGWFGVQLLITPKGRETFRLLCGNTEGVDDASAIQTK